MSIWDSIKGTAETLGGAAVAPVGAVVDLAQMPFDDKDDDLGSVVNVLASRTNEIVSPVVGQYGLTGGVSRALAAMNWAYKNGVDEPLGTATMVGQHAFGGSAPAALASGALFAPDNWAKITDPDAWSKAYATAQTQSFGQSQAFALLDNAEDPQAYRNPYAERTAQQYGNWASAVSLGTDLGTAIVGDPTYAALKGAGAVRGLTQYAKLAPYQKAGLFNEITSGSRTGVLRQNLTSRTDKYLGWIGGKNSVGRPLSAKEIYYGTPELQRYGKDPQAVAGFLADANKITDPVARLDSQRRILAIAGGDLGQIDRLRNESTEAASLADQMSNMVRGSVIDLDTLAVAPNLANNPVFRLRLENQLNNINKTGDVDKFFDEFLAYNDRLLETQKSLPNLPGVHGQGKRTLSRLNDQGLARAPRNTLDNWSAALAQRAQSTSGVFQKGKYTVPLVAVRTVGLAASPWTSAPIAVSDALRQPAFTGIASIHDWGNATGQLDAMMEIGRVAPDVRRGLLDEAYIANTESAKQTIINKVENASVQHLAKWAGEHSGRELDSDYITEIMSKGAAKRSDRLTSLQGRVYATTEATPDMGLRAGSAQRIEDQAALTQSSGFTAKSQGKWRLDQINDDGTPLALPVFETQLGNHIPLFDIDTARRAVTRDNGRLANLSRAWRDESRALGHLSNLKAAGATGLDRLIESRAYARDWLVDMGQMLLRGWKFGVLFRLGYPLRVLTDDHMRIWSKIGAGSFYGPNLREFGGNLKANLGRGKAARAQMHDLRVRRQQVEDELSSNEMMVHVDRQNDLKAIDRRIGSHQRAVAGLRKQVQDEETKASLGLPNNAAALRKALTEREGELSDHEAGREYTLEQLGDYGPDKLKLELEDLNAQIDGGAKALREPKKHIGDADVQIADDLTVPGAFAGEYGDSLRAASGSGSMYDHLLDGAEERTYRAISGGSHRTIQPSESGHLNAWADVLNNQIATSEVGKFFLEGKSVQEFTRWIKQPEQAALRRRVAHFAHDPEDWGTRAHGIVHDYVPNEAVQLALRSGRVTPKQLRNLVAVEERPAVHGRAAADNLGHSHAVQSVSHALNRMFRVLSETPTDTLSRHPFFNALYRRHAKDFYAVKKAGLGKDYRFTQDDIDEISHLSRRAALKDVKSTLFDLSAHSHAAHVLRFISPFFGAHQEGVARWWRIAADSPQIVRRFTQAMELPRWLGLEVDENGEVVKPGDPISGRNRFLLQLPQAFGGPDPTEKQSSWSIPVNSFNVVMQGGIANPGTGPLVSVPMDWAAKHYADDPAITRVARIFNPFPANSPLENALPATVKRLSAYVYGETGVDPSLGLGIGKREYNAAFSQNLQDATVDFKLKYDREPTRAEADELVAKVGGETTSQMFHRMLWNGLSPAPASPRSKYALFQQGWYKLQEQAKAEGKDFDWAYQQFKAKYGEAYLPLISSTANNPGGVDADAADVAAIKRYKGVLQKVDPALTRMVIGAYADDMIAKNKTLADYSPDARNFLRTQTVAPGSDETYYSYDEPKSAVDEQMARRGWAKYGELTGALTAQAQAMGLDSYNDSPELRDVKKQAVAALKAENYAWADDWDRGMDRGEYNRYLDDMRQIVASPSLANDPERTDIQTLKTYLELHDLFSQVFAAREQAGLGTFEAQAQDPIRQVYSALVGKLVESNTYFEQYIYNGTVDRDPWLSEAA